MADQTKKSAASAKETSFRMKANGLVDIKHPELEGQVAEVLPESLAVWLDAGWALVDADEVVKDVVVVVDNEERTGVVTTVEHKEEAK